MDPRRRHRRLLAPALAVMLAIELSVVSLAVGRSIPLGPAQPAAPALAVPGAGSPADRAVSARPAGWHTAFHGAVPAWVAGDPVPVARPVVRSTATPANSVPNVAVAAVVAKPAPVAPKPTKVSGSTTKATGTTTRAAPSYKGRNHLWIPSLGVNRSVSFYACSRSTALANVVYRWGCGGSNNVYLMGHAWGVFKPLHDAYYNGRLKKGMQVIYADANGRVTSYRVSFWKVVSPVGAGWAYAAQSRPSMTLQTCVGAGSKYRLVVRLVASR